MGQKCTLWFPVPSAETFEPGFNMNLTFKQFYIFVILALKYATLEYSQYFAKTTDGTDGRGLESIKWGPKGNFAHKRRILNICIEDLRCEKNLFIFSF